MKNPFKYTGNKTRILPTLMAMLPSNIETFYDCFGGSGVVGLTAFFDEYKAKRLHYNELNEHIHNLMCQILFNKKFVVDVIRWDGDISSDKEGFDQLKANYTKFKDDDTTRAAILFNVIARSFSNDIRFNSAGEINIPYGKRRHFDVSTLRKLNNRSVIAVSTSNGSYTDCVNAATVGDFLFFDPPYLNTTATYNTGWSEDDERELYKNLDRLTASGINWMLTNTIENKGKTNEILSNWILNNKNLFVRASDTSYNNSSFRKSDMSSVELIITNYEPKNENSIL